MAITRNQARKWNLKRTRELKCKTKGRVESLFDKNAERSKRLSAKMCKPDVDKRNYNHVVKAPKWRPRYNLVNPMQVPGQGKNGQK